MRPLALIIFLLREFLGSLGFRYSISLVFFVVPLFWVLENGLESSQSESTLSFLVFACVALPFSAYLSMQQVIQKSLKGISLLPVHRVILLLALGVARLIGVSFGLLHSGVVLLLASLFLSGGGRTHAWIQVIKNFLPTFWASRTHPWVVESFVFFLSTIFFLMFFSSTGKLRNSQKQGSLTKKEVHLEKKEVWLKNFSRVTRWVLVIGFFSAILLSYQYSRVLLVVLVSFLLILTGLLNGLGDLSASRQLRTRWGLIFGLLLIVLNASMVRVTWNAATSSDLMLFAEGQEALGVIGPDLPSERWGDLLKSLQGKSTLDAQRLQIALQRINGGHRLPPVSGGIQFEKFLESIQGSPGEVAGLLSLFEPSLLKGSHAIALLRKMSQFTVYPDLPWELLKVPMEPERIAEALRSSEPVLQDFGLLLARIRYSGVASQGFRAEQGRSQVLAELWAQAILSARDERFQKRIQNTLRMILQKDPTEAIQRARTAFERFREERHLDPPSLFKVQGDEPPPVSLYVEREGAKGGIAQKGASSSSLPRPSPHPQSTASVSSSAAPALIPSPAPVPSPSSFAPLPVTLGAPSAGTPLVTRSESDRPAGPVEAGDTFTPPQKTKTLSQMLDAPNQRIGEKRVRVDTRAILAIPQDDRPPPRRLTRQEYLQASQTRADKISQALEPLHESVIAVRWLERPEVARFVYDFIRTHQLVQFEVDRIACQKNPFSSAKSVQQDPNPSFMDACLWWLSAQRAFQEERRFAFFAHEELFPFEGHFSYLQSEDQAWVLEVLGFSLPLDRGRGF